MRESYLVNLKNDEDYAQFQKQLHSLWHFENENIVRVLEYYKEHGEVKKYGEVHYLILFDLIEAHLQSLDEKEKRAFFAYNKARLISIHNPNVPNQLLTFLTAALTPACSAMLGWSKNGVVDFISAGLLLVIWVIWAITNFLSIKVIGSPANSFYESLFDAFTEKKSNN